MARCLKPREEEFVFWKYQKTMTYVSQFIYFLCNALGHF